MQRWQSVAVLVVALGLSSSLAFSHEKAVKNLPSVYPPPKPERAIVLTFDDGPRQAILPQILDFLKEEDLSATFFVQCWQVKGNEELLMRAARAGHGIANHTYGHGRFDEMMRLYSSRGRDGKKNWAKGKEWVFNDIEKCSRLIKGTIGYRPLFFRPRSWIIEERYPQDWEYKPVALKNKCAEEFPQDKIFKEEIVCQGYLVQVLDNPKLKANFRFVRDVNTLDYEFHDSYRKAPQETVRALVRRVAGIIKERERSGVGIHILTFHELPVSLEALRVLVPEWKKAGYEFRTLPWVYGIGEKEYGR